MHKKDLHQLFQAYEIPTTARQTKQTLNDLLVRTIKETEIMLTPHVIVPVNDNTNSVTSITNDSHKSTTVPLETDTIQKQACGSKGKGK